MRLRTRVLQRSGRIEATVRRRLEPVPATEFAGIWGGATRTEWRGRGIYRALTAARARSALVLGKRLIHSDSSEESSPILEGAGLVKVSTTTPYLWSPAGRRVGRRAAASHVPACGNVTRRAAIQPAPAAADRHGVTARQASTAVALTITALAVVIASATWAYSTFDFWEGGPILASLCAFAAAAGGTVYVATRRRLLALVVAVLLGSAHFVLLLAITLARWEG
jgi:hypothetical protein